MSGVGSGLSALATCNADMWLEGVRADVGNRWCSVGMEGFSKWTRCFSRQGSAMLMLLPERVRLGSRTTYAAPEVRV